jgi:hypothetical protein
MPSQLLIKQSPREVGLFLLWLCQKLRQGLQSATGALGFHSGNSDAVLIAQI